MENMNSNTLSSVVKGTKKAKKAILSLKQMATQDSEVKDFFKMIYQTGCREAALDLIQKVIAKRKNQA